MEEGAEDVFAPYKAFSEGPVHPTTLCAASITNFAAKQPAATFAPDYKKFLCPALQGCDALSASQRDAVVMARARHVAGSGFLLSLIHI